MEEGGRNHLGEDREFLPIELGGFPDISSIELNNSPLKVHFWKSVTYASADVKNRIGLCAFLSIQSSLKHFAETDYEEGSLTQNIIEIAFSLKSHSKVKEHGKRVIKKGIDLEKVRKIINTAPYLAFTTPTTKIGLLTKLTARLFSNTSHIALAYDNDVSNCLRMIRNCTNEICTIGKPDFGEDDQLVETEKGNIYKVKRTFKGTLDFLKEKAELDDYTPYIDKIPSLGTLPAHCVPMIEALRSSVVQRDPRGEILMTDTRLKGTFKKVFGVSEVKTTYNNAFSVVMYKWYPKFEEDCGNAIRDKVRVERDFRLIKNEFNYIKDSIEDTMVYLGIEDSEESRYMLVSNLATDLLDTSKNAEIVLTKFNETTKGLYYFLDFATWQTFDRNKLSIIVKPKFISNFEFRMTARPIGEKTFKFTNICTAIVTCALFVKFKCQDLNLNEQYVTRLTEYLLLRNSTYNDYTSLYEFIMKTSFKEIMDVLKVPKLIKSIAVIYSLMSNDEANIVQDFYEKYNKVYYSYNIEQNRTKDTSFDVSTPVDFTVVYHNSKARYIKDKFGPQNVVGSKITLDMSTSVDLESLMKLVTSFALDSGYSPMPDEVLLENIKTQYFLEFRNIKEFFKEDETATVLTRIPPTRANSCIYYVR
jgi:hypothetical protein